MSLNVIGLISGGKDSLFNLAHCVHNGHDIIALVNLYPASDLSSEEADETEGQDLNSFMYQTVGHSVIPLYAEALGIPLYRREISGNAAQTGRYYDSSKEMNGGDQAGPDSTDALSTSSKDETEDMYLLIKDILVRHPEANALAAGAILSTYQRTRVESVATRLNLVPLAYLWQYPFLPPPMNQMDTLTRLLDDMATAGCDARMIKIASGGIDAELLSANVTAPSIHARLVKGLSQIFGDSTEYEAELRASILGEGGEYETLALDGPSLLWKKRIDLQTTGVRHEEGVSYAKLGKALLVEKTQTSIDVVPIPAMFDLRFQKIWEHIQSDNRSFRTIQSALISQDHTFATTYVLSTFTLQINNLIFKGTEDLTVTEQLTTILTEILPALLERISNTHKIPCDALSMANIVHSILLLRSMDVFVAVNTVYATHLWPAGLPNPPARVTIAANLPANIDVSLSIVFDLGGTPKSRNGLHVQSRSYWAPANIGPYSQAVSVPLQRAHPTEDFTNKATSPTESDIPTKCPIDIVHVAGQIPLISASMTLPEADFQQQAVLALQHLWRVGQERTVDLWTGSGVAYLASTSNPTESNMEHAASVAAQIWQLAHMIDEKGASKPDGQNQANTDEEDDNNAIDIWDLQQNRQHSSHSTQVTIGEHLHVLPNFDMTKDSPLSIASQIPPFIAVEVSGLPRGASIEWWSFGLAGLTSSISQDQYRISTNRLQFKSPIHAYILAIEGKDGGFTEVEQSVTGMKNVYSATLVVPTVVDASSLSSNAVHDVFTNQIIQALDVLSASVEIVTSHSFINLSQSHAGTICNDELVAQSSVIPCRHVWIGIDDGIQDQLVQEVTAVVLLRFEVLKARHNQG